jgi:glycosyltransferase involved in cell wall biosynthesis
VATTPGGLAETVHDGITGYTAGPGDPTSLAAAISRALTATDTDRHQMRAAGRDLLHRRHRHPATVARFLTDHAPWAIAQS